MSVRALVVLGFGLVGCGSDDYHWEWPEAAPAEVGMDATVLEGAKTYAFAPGKNTVRVIIRGGCRGGPVGAGGYAGAGSHVWLTFAD